MASISLLGRARKCKAKKRSKAVKAVKKCGKGWKVNAAGKKCLRIRKKR